KNTRDTSGGFGAITFPTSGNKADCGNLALESRRAITPGVLGPVRENLKLADNCVNDWDDIDHYVQTIRPPRGPQRLADADVALIAQGRDIFGGAGEGTNRGNCVKCHGGQGFTVSHVFWEQNTANNAALADATLGKMVVLNTQVANIIKQ